MVAHTRARSEKKVVEWALGEGVRAELPTYRTMHRYRGKVVSFQKVLFPGYVFLEGPLAFEAKVRQNRHVARVLMPADQAEFGRELGDILEASRSGLEIRPAPGIVPGVRVQITAGPLRGMEGWVERRADPLEVYLRLAFIGHSAVVRVSATDLEIT